MRHAHTNSASEEASVHPGKDCNVLASLCLYRGPHKTWRMEPMHLHLCLATNMSSDSVGLDWSHFWQASLLNKWQVFDAREPGSVYPACAPSAGQISEGNLLHRLSWLTIVMSAYTPKLSRDASPRNSDRRPSAVYSFAFPYQVGASPAFAAEEATETASPP